MNHINNVIDILAHSGISVSMAKAKIIMSKLPEVFTTTQVIEVSIQLDKGE